MSPRMLSLKVSRAYFGETQRAVGNRDFTLKGEDLHKISHIPGPRAETIIWKEPESDLCADLGKSGKERGTWSTALGHRRWWQPFWGAQSTMWTQVLAISILESFLQIISLRTQPCLGLTACRHQLWDASGQATKWVGTQPTSRQAALRPLETTVIPVHVPANQKAQDPALHTNMQAIDLGSQDPALPTSGQASAPECPGPQPHQWACSILGTSLTHQQVDTSHSKTTAPHTAMAGPSPPISRPTQASGHPRHHCQLCQKPIPSTCGLTPALGPRAWQPDPRTWLCLPVGWH